MKEFFHKIWELRHSDHPGKDIKNFIFGMSMHFMYTHNMKFMLRRKDVFRFLRRLKRVRPICMANGECMYCSCFVPEMFWVKDCSDKCGKKR